MIDLKRAIKTTISTGKITVGIKETVRAYDKGELKLVIVASNAPRKDFGKAPVHYFKGDNVALGTACGKPFPVAVFGILEPGESNILSLETSG